MIQRRRWPLLVAGERVVIEGRTLLQGTDVDMGPGAVGRLGRLSAPSAVRLDRAIPPTRAGLLGLADYGKGASK